MRLFGFNFGKRATAVGAATTANSADIPENAHLWRKMGSESIRNLRDFQHREMVAQCTRSAQSDGMCRSHVRLVTAATVGASELEPIVRCENDEARKRLQEILRTFWRRNELHICLPEFMDGLTTTGSLALPMLTDTDDDGVGSNLTTVGYLDPSTFVEPFVLPDPMNARNPLAVLRRGVENTTVAHPILRADDTVAPMFRNQMGKAAVGTKVRIGTEQITVGVPCFYLGVNRIAPNQTAGISDLYPVLDLCGLTDELVHGAVLRSINIGAMSLHAKFPSGTDEKDIEKVLDRIRRVAEGGEGGIFGTADVEIAALYAALQSGEWAQLERMGRLNILIGLGPWPAHVFSDGGTTNVATAAEQGSPIANFLLTRQNMFRKLLVAIAGYAVRRVPEGAKLWAANPDIEVEIPLPIIVAKDTTRESNTLTTELNALLTSVDNGLITLEAAQREARDAMNRYGFRVDVDDAPDADEFESAPKFSGLPMPSLVKEDEDPDADPKKVSEGTPKRAAAMLRVDGAGFDPGQRRDDDGRWVDDAVANDVVGVAEWKRNATKRLRQAEADLEEARAAHDRLPEGRRNATERDLQHTRDRMALQLKQAKQDGDQGRVAKWTEKRASVTNAIEAKRNVGNRLRRVAALREGAETGKLTISESEMVSMLHEQGDTYVDSGLIRRGASSRGLHAPDTFITSDLTGLPIRRYVILPDGRTAHPDELILARKRGRLVVVEALRGETAGDQDTEPPDMDEGTPKGKGVTAAGFDPNQPRREDGEWTATGDGVGDTDTPKFRIDLNPQRMAGGWQFTAYAETVRPGEGGVGWWADGPVLMNAFAARPEGDETGWRVTGTFREGIARTPMPPVLVPTLRDAKAHLTEVASAWYRTRKSGKVDGAGFDPSQPRRNDGEWTKTGEPGGDGDGSKRGMWKATVKGLRWDLWRDGKSVARVMKTDGSYRGTINGLPAERDEWAAGVELWEHDRLRDAKEQTEEALDVLARKKAAQ